MRYRWGDYCLDRQGTLLTRRGEHVSLSRKQLDGITHLIEQRHRVVPYDELIRAIWGHDHVTHNQLSQVILSLRRTLGDDSQSQRLIRTLPGLGYRWVGEVVASEAGAAAPSEGVPPADMKLGAPARSTAIPQVEHRSATSATTAPIAPPQSAPQADHALHHATEAAPERRLGLRYTLIALGVAAALGAAVFLHSRPPSPSPGRLSEPVRRLTATPSASDPVAALQVAFRMGKYEDVRQGLANLPPEQADMPDARILEIDLDIGRGRFENAERKLAREYARAKRARDPVWQSKLYVAESFLNGSAGKPGIEVLTPAQTAVALLESTGNASATHPMGQALSARGYGQMKVHRLEPAMRDLLRARDLLLTAGDQYGAADTADTLARIKMRVGQFAEALELMNEVAEFGRAVEAPVQEIYARNAATKIYVEQLRWDAALQSIDRSAQLLRAAPDSERRFRVFQLRALVLTGLGRLREAASLIEENEALQDPRYSTIVAANYHLAAGQAKQALAAAAKASEFKAYDTGDTLNLETTEGALLLWVTAAQRLAAEGDALPSPSAAQLALLRKPNTNVGRIARGRRLWSQGKTQAAEEHFRLALRETREKGHLARMLLASEPLIEMLLQQGDIKSAEQAFSELRGVAPERLDRDYRARLLDLRIALAAGHDDAIAQAYRNAAAVAGERRLPADVVGAYTQRGAAR
jgi:DNA-binding winged helix-turn-helix (wHTH) protein/tetratricopeptide (TPR) repeat protein